MVRHGLRTASTITENAVQTFHNLISLNKTVTNITKICRNFSPFRDWLVWLVAITTGSVSAVAMGGALDNQSSLGLPPMTVPGENVLTAKKISLGKMLFFDQRLSSDGTVACATCHRPDRAFSDGRAISEGAHKRAGARNAPGLLNVAFSTSLFWDGRRNSLELQALDPLLNPREHALTSFEPVLAVVRSDAAYVSAFRDAFSVAMPEIGIEHVAKALSSYERSLIAANSSFDRYYFSSEASALSPDARRGLALFQGRANCSSCHTIGQDSATFSDGLFHRVNLGESSIAKNLDRLTTALVEHRRQGHSLDQTIIGDQELAALGRFAVTLNAVDIESFKTPSLRNVALTAPYMHDGSVPTLLDAIEAELYRRSGASNRPLILTPREKLDLLAFLHSLTSPEAQRHIDDAR